MSVSLETKKLPPSGRDFGVYTAVRVQERTTREVAAEFGISQTRVCQIVERVALFMLEAVPEGTEADHAKRVQLAEQVAALRVQFMYGTAVRDYEASKGKPVIREINAEGRPRTTITTTKVDVGDVKLLDRAVKFAIASGKLAAPTLSQHVAWEERDAAGEAQEECELRSPAEEGCSELVAEQGAEATRDAAPDDVRFSGSCVCESMKVASPAPKLVNAAPVQATSQPADGAKPTLRQRVLRRAFFAAAG